jgi:sarcosine oxidase
MAQEFDVVVVGAGVNGLATAWWLLRRGVKRVAVVERFAIGHDRGSSHGASRITRSAYADPLYVALMKVAHASSWPALEAEAGAQLIHKRDGCFFGNASGLFGDYLAAIEGADVDVERLDAAEGRRRFPMFRFPGDVEVLHDRTAGVVAAHDTVHALSGLVRAGATLLEGVTVHAIDPVRRVLETDRGQIRGEKLIVTAGAWAGALFPSLKARLAPILQTVTYLDIPGDPREFPVWAWRGDTVDHFYYGLPEFQRPGLKAAHHQVDGRWDDPDAPRGEPETASVLEFLSKHLSTPPRSVLATERCLYTCTDDEDFILDTVAPDVVVGAGFSGHGFKFAPLTGQILAELALDGTSSVAAFEQHRARFR